MGLPDAPCYSGRVLDSSVGGGGTESLGARKVWNEVGRGCNVRESVTEVQKGKHFIWAGGQFPRLGDSIVVVFFCLFFVISEFFLHPIFPVLLILFFFSL